MYNCNIKCSIIKISIKYYISKRRGVTFLKEEDYRLFMSLHYGGKRMLFYPGIYLSSLHWDKTSQTVVNRADKENLNILLQNLKSEVIRIFKTLIIQNPHLDSTILRKALSEIKVDRQFALTNAFIRYMEDRSDSWSHNTYMKFKSLYIKLRNYEAINGLNLSLEAADESFMKKFYNYLISEGLQISSANVYLNNVKTFLAFAVKKNWLINKNYLNYQPEKILKADEKKSSLTFLNFEAIMELYNLDLENRKWQQARDIFCLIAFTGIRYSEIRNLKVNGLINNNLHIEGQRSRIVPLNTFALEILKKYENKYYRNSSLLPVYSEITVNKYLRNIFSEHKLVLFHADSLSGQKISIAIAYNSFMANAVHFGISPLIVRKWSANKTLSRYSAIKRSIEMSEKLELDNINKQFQDGK